MRLRIYTIDVFIGVRNIYVLYFFVLYFMGTALLVITNISQTQKWAAEIIIALTRAF